jgi:TonB family protein
MIHRIILFAILTLFGASASSLADAQTPDSPKRKCKPPVVLHQEDPPLSRRLGDKAVVSLNISLDETGSIIDASILKPSGDDKFDEGAVQTIKQKWKFKPSLCDGKPSPTHFVVEMH